jgi:hypothetical protein
MVPTCTLLDVASIIRLFYNTARLAIVKAVTSVIMICPFVLSLLW